MIDTISLRVPDVSEERIKGLDKWDLYSESHSRRNEKGVFDRDTPSGIAATRYLNKRTDDHGAEVHEGTVRLEYVRGRSQVNVSVSSLAAFHNGTALRGLSGRQISPAMDALAELVTECIDVDLRKEGHIWRLDNAALYRLDDTPFAYLSALNAVSVPSCFRMNRTWHNPGLTFQTQKKHKRVLFYDKGGYSQLRGYAAPSGMPENALRYEIQGVGIGQLRTMYKLGKGGELLIPDICDSHFQERMINKRIEMYDHLYKEGHTKLMMPSELTKGPGSSFRIAILLDFRSGKTKADIIAGYEEFTASRKVRQDRIREIERVHNSLYQGRDYVEALRGYIREQVN